jgi:hypothetical protein
MSQEKDQLAKIGNEATTDLAIFPENQREQITLNLTIEQQALLVFLVEIALNEQDPDPTTHAQLTDILEQLKSTTDQISEIFRILHTYLKFIVKTHSNKIILNLTSAQKKTLAAQVNKQWKSSLSNPDIKEAQGDILLGICAQLEDIDSIFRFRELIMKSVRRATLKARREGLPIGAHVGISDSPDELTYELLSIDGESATIGYDTHNGQVKKVVKLTYLFNLNDLRDETPTQPEKQKPRLKQIRLPFIK